MSTIDSAPIAVEPTACGLCDARGKEAMRAPVADFVSVKELERDPYPLYRRLRASMPIAYVPTLEEYLVTRWDACNAIAALDLFPSNRGTDEFFGTPNVLSLEGDEHQRLRAGIDARLTPRAVRDYVQELVRPIVVEKIDQIVAEGEGDLATDLAVPISVRAVGDVIGLKDVDEDTLTRWFNELSDGSTNLSNDQATATAAAATLNQIDQYMRQRIDDLTRQPDESLISQMIHVGTIDGAPRTFDELMPSIRVIILGGLQEPGRGLAATLHGLLTRPEQLAAVATEPRKLVPLAVQEGLRWIAPIGVTSRTAKHDIVHDGVTIPEGAEFALVIASANRDEARFADGEHFNVFRQGQHNATFGYGSHFCAGHFLSRSILNIAVEEIVLRMPHLRADNSKGVEISGYSFRGVYKLPAVWG